MSKKDVAKIAVFCSLPCAVLCMLWGFLPETLSPLMWCMFVGYCTTYLFNGADIRQWPKTAANYGVGVVWALAYWYFFVLLLNLGVNYTLAMFIDVEVITALIMFVHIGFLSKTCLNKVAMLFPAVFCIFECGGNMATYPWMILSVLIGSFCASISDPFTALFFHKK